jgi:endonuclease YncB( thermonuclease family)
MAWVYDKYVTDLNLYALQENAKIKKLGLWSDPDPIQPWIFRHKK